MIPVGNKQIDTNVPELFRRLKNFVLERDGKEIFKDMREVAGNNLMVTCPFHKDGHERKPSCGINTKPVDGQIWVHCFTCGYKNILDVAISKILGFDDSGEEGRKWLLANFEMGYNRNINIQIATSRQSGKSRMALEMIKHQVGEEMLEKYRFIHPYMYKRGLTDELIEKYDIGYDEYNQCITFPVRDINGTCIFLAKRSVNNKFFVLPSEQDKPLYGVYELDYDKPDIYICESFFNALTLAKWGHNAIALMGTGSNTQYDLLNHLPFRTIHLCLDGDLAGRIGTKKLLQEISYNKIVYNHILPEGKDVNDLCEEEFNNLRVELRSIRHLMKEY